MGWASGGEVADPVIKAVKENVPDEKARRKIYDALIDALQSRDWDTEQESMGIDDCFDEALRDNFRARGVAEEDLP